MGKSKIIASVVILILVISVFGLIIFNKKDRYTTDKEILTSNTTKEIENNFKISNKEENWQTSSSLKVGDYVSYTYDIVEDYELTSEVSGYAQSQIIPQEELKWKVLEINKDGTVKLISEGTTSNDVHLGKYVGYNNGVYVLNDICKSQYSNNKIGAIARSICIEDIENVLSETGLQRISEYSTFFTNVKYGETKVYTGYYPTLYARENGPNSISFSDSYYDTATTEKYEKSETNGLNVTQTFYYLSNVSRTDIVNEDIYNVLFGNPLHYWVSSRYTSASSTEQCGFGIRCVTVRSVSGLDMFGSAGVSYGDYKYLRPVVELPADLGYSYDNGIWSIKSKTE